MQGHAHLEKHDQRFDNHNKQRLFWDCLWPEFPLQLRASYRDRMHTNETNDGKASR